MHFAFSFELSSAHFWFHLLQAACFFLALKLVPVVRYYTGADGQTADEKAVAEGLLTWEIGNYQMPAWLTLYVTSLLNRFVSGLVAIALALLFLSSNCAPAGLGWLAAAAAFGAFFA